MDIASLLSLADLPRGDCDHAMASDESNSGVGLRAASAFLTTHWTMVLEAAQPGAGSGVDAFAQLYRDYWYPLYAFVRRRGYTVEEAEDITQGFFASILEREALAGIRRDGGRFRSFLLTGLVNFLADVRDRERALKRGGGQKPIPLDIADGETRFAHEPASGETPESIFERRWALVLLDHVFQKLQAECIRYGKGAFFLDVWTHLQGDRHGPPYAEVAARQGTSEANVKVTVHRMRQRYRCLLREEIARTVSSPEEVEEELRYLREVVGR